MIRLEPCDLVFVRGGSWVSRAILRMTRSPGEARTRVSHVGVVVDSGAVERDPLRDPPGAPLIVEALSRGVICRPMPDGYAYAVFRPTNLTSADRVIILAKLRGYVGRPYGWGKVALHALDGLLGGARVFRRLAFVDGAPICSWAPARAWEAAGLTFGIDSGAASPDDLWDFCVSRTDKYRKVYP